MNKNKFNLTIIIIFLLSIACFIFYKCFSNIFFLFISVSMFICLIIYFITYHKKHNENNKDIKEIVENKIKYPKTIFDNILKEYFNNNLFDKFDKLDNIKLYLNKNNELELVFYYKKQRIFVTENNIKLKNEIINYSSVDELINKIKELIN